MSEFSLKQIQVFVAVAELGSFTQAAQALFLSQSTVSAHLAALETALSTRLLDRDARRRVRLTPEGERVYPAAKKILADCAALEEVLQNQDGAGLPLLLGASTVPAQYLLPELLAQYMKQITGVRYHLRRGDSAQIHKLLHSGSVRLGFVGAMLEPDSMTYFPMLEDHLVMCTANNPHYQALKKQNVYGRDLLREPTVAREEGSGTDRTVQSYMRNMGLADQDLHIVARVDDPEAIKRMTAQGVGVSVLSALSVAAAPQYLSGLPQRDDPLPVGAGLCPLLPPDGHSPESLIHSKVEKELLSNDSITALFYRNHLLDKNYILSYDI